jgi:Domain of unknown function (DUF5134)
MSMPWMHMPGPPIGNGAGAHSELNLVPEWLALAWIAIFVLIAGSHLRHMANTSGQRRAWHSCHVLMAVGMAFMYAPAAIDPLGVPTTFWRLVFASAGLLAALWALGGVGRVPMLIWLLTSIDLSAMIYMWSGSEQTAAAPVTWLLVAYLVATAAMWSLDVYRRLDGATPIFSLQILTAQPNGTATVTGTAAASGSLLGELDISASMIALALGMAYMVTAMQLRT